MKTYKNIAETRVAFRKFLVKATGCSIQGGWPCGTCTMQLLTDLGLDSDEPEYKERNEEPDRHNEVWRAILQIREHDGEYKASKLLNK